MADQLFRIYHSKTCKYRDIWAENVVCALAIAKWKCPDCKIRVRTEKGGWKNVEAK